MKDDQVANLEAHLADKKYQIFAHQLVLVQADLERAQEQAKTEGFKIVELEEEAITTPDTWKFLQVAPNPEELNPTDDVTTERSVILEDRADHKDKVIDWLRKKVENPVEHEQVQDKMVNVILNDFTEVTTEMKYTIPTFLWVQCVSSRNIYIYHFLY